MKKCLLAMTVTFSILLSSCSTSIVSNTVDYTDDLVKVDVTSTPTHLSLSESTISTWDTTRSVTEAEVETSPSTTFMTEPTIAVTTRPVTPTTQPPQVGIPQQEQLADIPSSVEVQIETIPTTATTTVQATTPTTVTPSIDINSYIQYAKNYGSGLGLNLDSSATACWDNPIYVNSTSKGIERTLRDALDFYKSSGFSAVWVWSESISDGAYNIYIGYA